ncbi:MAG TPA: hypothetical protein VH684_24810 [Xanthobacteraceae bacterium]|jgi:hypothetical protein
MTIYYPARDGHPSMFEDDAGFLLKSAPLPVSQSKSRDADSSDRSTADLLLTSTLIPMGVLDAVAGVSMRSGHALLPGIEGTVVSRTAVRAIPGIMNGTGRL